MSYNSNIVHILFKIVPCYLALENVANNCIDSPARKAEVAITIMLALKKRSSLYRSLSNHFTIVLWFFRLSQFLRSTTHQLAPISDRRDISSILTMLGMIVKIEVMMPACCRVNESLKTTMQRMNTKGTIYNNTSKIILISNLALYFSYLGLLPWILPYYKDVYTKIDK